MTGKATLYGRELSSDELAHIRAGIVSFDVIVAVDDDMRALIEDQWPDLVAKLPPRIPCRQPGTRQKGPG